MSRSKRSNEPGHTAAHYSFRGEGRVRSQATSAPAVSTGNGTIRLGTRVRLCGNNVTVYGRVKVSSLLLPSLLLILDAAVHL